MLHSFQSDVWIFYFKFGNHLIIQEYFEIKNALFLLLLDSEDISHRSIFMILLGWMSYLRTNFKFIENWIIPCLYKYIYSYIYLHIRKKITKKYWFMVHININYIVIYFIGWQYKNKICIIKRGSLCFIYCYYTRIWLLYKKC